jgi:hypothetical protein
MTAPAWTPAELDRYISGHYGLLAGKTAALAMSWLDAGLSVAVYENGVIRTRNGQPVRLLLPCPGIPPRELPCTDGEVAWPLTLQAVCRQELAAVVPIRRMPAGKASS